MRSRTTVYYSGHVQGVGFRYTTASIARQFSVTGFVQNLADRRVELVVEGEPSEVAKFLAEVRERFAHQIRNEQADQGPATGEHDSFAIRR